MKSKIFILFLIIAFLTTTGAACQKGDPAADKAIKEPIELKIWGVFDSSDAYSEIINSYRMLHPNIKITYSKLRWEDYETQLLESWAAGEGPDIFAVHNTWVGKYTNKILPLPAQIKLPVISSAGAIGSKAQAVFKTFDTITAAQMKNVFPDVVAADFVKDNQVLGLPLSVDTLALFYNRDHFNAAGITGPPATWQELIDDVIKLTRQDDTGNFITSGVALGGADNINRSNDILALLMLQNGASMIENNDAVFNKSSSYDRQFYPGEQALRFYTDFALPSKEVYSWNQDMPESLEAFSAGQLSMMFGYSYQIPLIQTQAPKINFSIASLPHIKSDSTDALGIPINQANYWGYSVFKNSAHPNEAWDFITFMTLRNYQDENQQTRYYAENYLKKTNKPPALRALFKPSGDPLLSPFISQILTAQNWYHGKDPNQMNTVFKQMIKNIITGQTDYRDAINAAARAISQSY